VNVDGVNDVVMRRWRQRHPASNSEIMSNRYITLRTVDVVVVSTKIH